MTTLEDFADLTLFLQQATSADPVLALTSTIAWLDPLAVPDIYEEIQDNAQSECELSHALLITRESFPAVYVQTLCALRQDCPWKTLEHLITQGINQQVLGPGIHGLEELGFYIPYESTAVAIFDPAFDELPLSIRQTVLDTLGWFGLTYDEAIGGLDEGLYQQAGHTAEILAISLRELNDAHYADLAMLLEWVFSRTGNTLADYTDEEIADSGMDAPGWRCYDIEHHNEVQAEAYEVVEQAQRGYAYCRQQPNVIHTLKQNSQIILAAVQRWQEGQIYHEFQQNAARLAAGCEWTKLPPAYDERSSSADTPFL